MSRFVEMDAHCSRDQRRSAEIAPRESIAPNRRAIADGLKNAIVRTLIAVPSKVGFRTLVLHVKVKEFMSAKCYIMMQNALRYVPAYAQKVR